MVQEYDLLLYILSTSKERSVVYILNRLENLKRMLREWRPPPHTFVHSCFYAHIFLFQKKEKEKRKILWRVSSG